MESTKSTEHDGQLPSFSLGRRDSRESCDLRGVLFLGRRRLCWLSRWRDNFIGSFRFASPNESSAFVIDNWVNIEDFFLQVVEVGVIKVETSCQRTIGDPSLAFEEGDNLFENFIKRHGVLPTQPCRPVVNFLHQCRLEKGGA